MIVTTGMIGLLLLLLVLTAVAAAVLVAAPWSARSAAARVPVSTHLRVGRAVVGFDERPSARYATWRGALGVRVRRGLSWACVTAVVVAVLSMVTMLTWANAALASDATTTAGRPVSSPWIYQEVWQLSDDAFSVDTRMDGWVALIPLAAFAVGALAWRKPRQEIATG